MRLFLLRLLACAGLLAGTAWPAWAQAGGSSPYRFRHLTMADGLPQSSVHAVLHDRDGFIWIGTEDGLARYDGYRFAVYRPAAGDSATLPSGQIWAIAQTRDGALYAATAEGLGRLDPATGRVRRLPHRPNDPTTLPAGGITGVLAARDGSLYVSTLLGLARLAPATGLVRRLTSDDDGPRAVRCPNALLEGSDGGIWTGTWNGLARVNRLSGRVTRYLDRPGGNDCARTPGRAVLDLAEPTPGLLYAATDSGLIRLDVRTGALRRFVPLPGRRPGSPEGLQNYLRKVVRDPRDADVLWIASAGGLLRFDARAGRFTAVDLPGELMPNVQTIYADRSGLVWVGTYLSGAFRFDPHEVGFRTLRHDPGDPNSLASSSTYSMLVDRRGQALWAFGDAGSLLTRYDRRTGRVTRFPATTPFNGRLRLALYEDRRGTLWQAVPEGVQRYDPARGAFRLLRNPEGVSRSFNGIGEDAAGRVWVASRAGLNRVDPRADRYTGYFPVFADSGAAMRRGIAAALLDRADRFYVVLTDGEAFAFDPAAGRYARLGYAAEADPDAFGRGSPLRFFRDRAGRVWLVLHKAGLVLLDEARRRFVPYGTGTIAEGAFHLHERAREPGILWIATWSGLDRLDTRTGRVRHFTERDGLSNGYIYCILEDEAGRLWLSTNRGLTRFDPDRGTFRVYGPEHGLQGYEFNGNGYARAPDGELFFGGVEGVSAFYPARLRDDPMPPTVRVTGLRLFNRPVTPGPRSLLSVPLDRTAELRLPYDQNVVTFEFVGLHFKAPEQNRYSYRLEGFDRAWLHASTRREATYTNLRPGRYRFRVRAANADGVWNQSGATLAVVVLPPWWRTPLAYLAYALLLGGGVFAAARGQRRWIVRRERERTERLAERLRAEAAEARLDAMGRELAVAQRIQQGALPRELAAGPGLDRVEVAAQMIPAREVGGDLYDFFWVGDCCLAFAVGDVSGKGVPAALFMALTRSALRAVALTGLDPGACLARVNTLLHEEAVRGMFVSLFYGVLDVRTGVLRYASAGHHPPLVVRADGDVAPLPIPRNLALCLRAEAAYEERTHTLAPGDSLLLYTDGVTEAVGVGQDRFEDQRLRHVAARTAARGAGAQVAEVVAAVEAFAAGVAQSDDVTALSVRLRPHTAVPAPSGDGAEADTAPVVAGP